MRDAHLLVVDIGGTRRITSYNVCYTKLLRVGIQIVLHI